MAFVAQGSIGLNALKGAQTSRDMTLAIALNPGDMMVVLCASDNLGATGVTNSHTSAAFTSGSALTGSKIGEQTFSPGGVAADGVTLSAWLVYNPIGGSAVPASSNFRVNF